MQNVYKPMTARKKKVTWKNKKEEITRKENRKERKENGKSIFTACIKHEKLTVIDTDFNIDQCFIFTCLPSKFVVSVFPFFHALVYFYSRLFSHQKEMTKNKRMIDEKKDVNEN